ncbi:MAG: tRNA (N6-threonylcarbamoyladenosine(37)-N6)-methyltransferase TrmO [Alysiella sp.]|uniref:tRNA (N6-threonylcarbamoyladenosine(37)-N6)-methyltransferase TrmO n=1 Tax=Alysiella sp. TaxID=1872483 RepID=UPI0026DD7D56|nr:tRNA (N6-threonylcarbamoyladenosine(37)-N6)-methyltransferase TrmO [Alysiella sp.]MDO4434476.1 tRNA (N6-threonylcarbamoyladenosine(37)-N6)-methyltransferase TrmO [Alysiella sp.]
MQHTINSIAIVQSPYTQKFGIPRQPQLVLAARVCIVFHANISPDSVRGLEGFDYIWVQFLFHDVLDEGWAAMVRPPRLGGKKKMGVFATRSPHRPNHLGLSLLKLEKIEIEYGCVRLWCSGADLLDGTPVFDIKPYIPFVEARLEARAGFAVEPPPQLSVMWLPESHVDGLSPDLRDLIEQSIAQDPRPAYQDDPERIYVMDIAGYRISFRIQAKMAWILAANLFQAA